MNLNMKSFMRIEYSNEEKEENRLIFQPVFFLSFGVIENYG